MTQAESAHHTLLLFHSSTAHCYLFIFNWKTTTSHCGFNLSTLWLTDGDVTQIVTFSGRVRVDIWRPVEYEKDKGKEEGGRGSVDQVKCFYAVYKRRRRRLSWLAVSWPDSNPQRQKLSWTASAFFFFILTVCNCILTQLRHCDNLYQYIFHDVCCCLLGQVTFGKELSASTSF